MSVVRKLAIAATLWVGALLMSAGPANAQLLPSCTASISAVAFGNTDVTQNVNFDTTGTFSVTCTGLLSLFPIRVCANLGPGTGGGTSAANRFMLNGGSPLRYGLYQDGARAVPWGSSTWAAGSATPVSFTIAAPTTINVPIYGRVHSAQQTVPPSASNYTSVFAGGDAFIRWGLLSGLLGCDLLTTQSTATFNVTAMVPKTCRVSAGDLDFGPVGTLNVNIDAASALATTCTFNTAYAIQLDGGLQGATNPLQRKMMKGTEFVLYGLYRDAARSLAWGSTSGVNTLSGTGNGFAQPISVYGRVAPQTTPTTGGYQDTVVVTVTY